MGREGKRRFSLARRSEGCLDFHKRGSRRRQREEATPRLAGRQAARKRRAPNPAAGLTSRLRQTPESGGDGGEVSSQPAVEARATSAARSSRGADEQPPSPACPTSRPLVDAIQLCLGCSGKEARRPAGSAALPPAGGAPLSSTARPSRCLGSQRAGAGRDSWALPSSVPTPREAAAGGADPQ